MKVLLFILFLPALLPAQTKNVYLNLQLHRDFDRKVFTSTLEAFELDRYGTLFFFTDFDFGATGQRGSYFEISRNHRCFKVGKANANLSLQFNDGMLPDDGALGKGIPRTWLAGATVSEISWGTASFEVQALARQEFAADLGWQLTGVWDWPIGKTPIEFLGYIDWNTNETGHQPLSVQTEPQLQLRHDPWAVGTEVEISYNFTGAYTSSKGFSYHTWYVHPTLYLRLNL
jgi:hypothetical protein